ncbi:MAG: general stress protein [Fimbriimonas sp.]
MATTVVGLFDDRETAQAAVKDLVDAGFGRDHISIVAADPGGTLYNQHVDDEGSIAGEGAATGLTSGAVVGGLLGLLIGAGLIFVPAGVLAAGPIVGLIAGGAAGAAAGGVLGGLIGLGIPKEDADVYAEGVRRGGTLVTVSTDDANVDRAHTILDRDGAVDVEERAEAYRAEGFTGYDESAPVYDSEASVAERSRYRSNLAAEFPSEAPTNSADLAYQELGSSPRRIRAYGETGNFRTQVNDAQETPTGVPNDTPGIQTGGHAADGTPDTRGITEKVADTLTGDPIDDKTGKRVD